MPKTIWIFVDSFPFAALPKLQRLAGFYRWQILSGLGFSINIKAEMFAGHNPDDIGYFNEWTYEPNGRFRHHRHWLSLLPVVSSNYYADRIAHKVVGRLFGSGVLNIPFEYLSYFDRKGSTPYEDGFRTPSLFSRSPGLVKVRYSDFRPGPQRDQQVFDQALDTIQKASYETVFVASADLDHITHRYGVNSNEYWAKLFELDKLIGMCLGAFRERYPDGRVVLISDHGMANVTRGVTVHLEASLGPASEDKYLYFVDATMLRIWVFDNALHDAIGQCLSRVDYGRILTSDERVRFAVTGRAFGDYIFLLDEGVVFDPTFWGRGLPKAMHGYHPEAESQKGFVASNEPLFIEDEQPTAKRVFLVLEKLLCET